MHIVTNWLVAMEQKMEDNDQNASTRAEMEFGPLQTMEESTSLSPRCSALESKHKVFLSHSGAQKDFVDQLCIELERWHRFPFFDKRRSSLPIGEKFPRLIFDAIRQCHVGVLVLSEEFFKKSKWPMVELVTMVKELKRLDSRIKIIPVFYHISLDEWQDPKNRKVWISEWEKWAGEDKRIKVDEWKEALEILKPINSLVMNKNMGEVRCRQEIVKVVCNVVPSETRWDDSHVQGRSRLCKTIRQKIDEQEQHNGVQVVGLYGMGGIGKTTICKAMCNEMSQDFHGKVCHVELNSASEVELLCEVLRTFTDTQDELLDKLNVDKCRDQLRRCIKKDVVFLAIDNVSNNLEVIRQAKAYLGAGWGKGSVLVVTARSLEELRCLNQYVNESECMEMPELEVDEARSLFVNHVASGWSATIDMDEGLVTRCVERCYFSKGKSMGHHYVPFALQVLGEQFGSLGYDAELWDVQLKKIQDIFDLGLFGNKHSIFSILRSSYDSLTDRDKMLFMDVAIFLPTYAIKHWMSWYHQYTLFEWLSMVHGSTVEEMMRRLEGLKRKSLLENLGDGLLTTNLSMHDLWREFCVAEAKVGNSGDRRWLYVEEGGCDLGDISLVGRCRESMRRMCFLNEGWSCVSGERLEDFVNVSAMKVEVGSFIAPSELDLDLTELKQLKSLELRTHTLSTKCVGFEALRNLVFLSWTSYGIPTTACMEEIGRLTKLQVLEVEYFYGDELPDLSMLASLRVASFRRCPNVVTVRGLSSKMTNLRHLDLERCSLLQECPGVGDLYALEELILAGCSSLKELLCLRQLTKLRTFTISDCRLLTAVPGLSDLVALERFHAVSSGLASFPDMRKLTQLQDMWFSDLPRWGSLSLCEHSRLKQLDCVGCSTMKSLTCGTPLGALWFIDLTLCSRLEGMPDLANFPQLKRLRLGGCSSLVTLTSSKPLYALRILDLEGCSSLSALPAHLGSSVDLEELRLQQSGVVLSAEDVEKLQKTCARLVVFPSSARSRYDVEMISGSDGGEDELDDVEIHAESRYRSRRLPDSSRRDKVTRLVYTSIGASLLALTSIGVHKLWDWGSWRNSEGAYKLWQHSCGRPMINDMNDANPGEVVPCMAVSIPNDRVVISASGGEVSLFELKAFEVLVKKIQPPSTATSLAFYPRDGNVKAIGTEDSTIFIVKVHKDLRLEVVCALKGHEKRVTGLAFSETMSVMVSLGADAQLCMWRTEGWMRRQSKYGPFQPDAKSPCMGDIRVQFHSNGVHVLVVGESQLAVYDALKLDCLRQWVPESPSPAAISDAVFSCDSQQIYTSFVDGSVVALHAENLRPYHRFAPPLHTPRGVSGSTVYPLAVAAHPFGWGVFALGMSNGDVLEISPWSPPEEGLGSGESSGSEGPQDDPTANEIAQESGNTGESGLAKGPSMGNLHLILKSCIRATCLLAQVFPME